MKRTLVAMTFLFSLSLSAKQNIMTQIQEIDFAQSMTEETLVFLKNGQVVKLPKNNPALTKHISESRIQHDWVNLVINDEREIESSEKVQKPYTTEERENDEKIFQEEVYSPSVLGSMDWARKYFFESRYNSKESQCFNRAHVWTHDWRVKHQFFSMKIFLFFTRQYIRKYNFDWWFHVSPMIHVIEDGRVRERVMDIKYSRGPTKLKDWTNIFMRDDADCPVIEKYSDYADFPESGSCFLLRQSMYTYQPLDIENEEKFGWKKNRWVESEVKDAYAEAFDLDI